MSDADDMPQVPQHSHGTHFDEERISSSQLARRVAKEKQVSPSQHAQKVTKEASELTKAPKAVKVSATPELQVTSNTIQKEFG